MPLVRGRFLPEREKSRLVKRSFDVLVWLNQITANDLAFLDLLEHLRIYLTVRHSGICEVRLLVPSNFAKTLEILSSANISFTIIDPLTANSAHLGVPSINDHHEASELATLAHGNRVDCVVVPAESPLLAFIPAFVNDLQVLISDTSFLLRLSEFFVRGFDIPWTYTRMIWDGTWSTMYQLAEPSTFAAPMAFLNLMRATKVSVDVGETARSFIHNRLPQLCFARDRLIWLEMQRAASARDGFSNQKYAFEISYQLNFYYINLFGSFDHLALLVNGIFSLGLKEKQVGATYAVFLEKLAQVSPQMNTIFTKPSALDLITRLAQLRNLSAHRGSVSPSKVVQKPDREPTLDELDAYIRDAGQGWMFEELRDPGIQQLISLARQNARIAILERNTLFDDVVMIEIKGKFFWINPILDTSWNFRQVLDFTTDVIKACSLYLEAQLTHEN